MEKELNKKQEEEYYKMLKAIKNSKNYEEYSKHECIYFAHGWLTSSLHREHINYEDYYMLMNYILYNGLK